MLTKKIHHILGLIIALFIGLHLFNHFCSIFGADKHVEIMNSLRPFYRNIFVETILILSVLVQIISGINLFKTNRQIANTSFEKFHIYGLVFMQHTVPQQQLASYLGIKPQSLSRLRARIFEKIKC